MSRQWPTGAASLAGLAAALGFSALLLGFAAARTDGYSHLTKAVSELGSQGAPNMLGWNLLGFGATGLLLAAFGWGLGREAESGGRYVSGWLAGSGAAFAATAIPADMDRLNSPASLAHIGASLLVFVFWLPAVWRLAKARRTWPALAFVSQAALWAALAALLIRFADLVPPGLAQRLSFLSYFGWVLAASVLLRRGRPALP